MTALYQEYTSVAFLETKEAAVAKIQELGLTEKQAAKFVTPVSSTGQFAAHIMRAEMFLAAKAYKKNSKVD